MLRNVLKLSPWLIQIIGAAAAPFSMVWQLGTDDSSQWPFSQESFSPNNPPGSASLRDDDHYLAGTYPSPIGVLPADEDITFFERAVTAGDPRNRIHFNLTALQASPGSRLRVTIDLNGGGAWINGTIPGYATHDIAVRFNGVLVGGRNAITWDTTLEFTLPASSVAAVAGANTLQIERTGGAPGGYLGFDYIKLEADPDALLDADNDGMPLWFEEIYQLNPAVADALLDSDNDGLNHLAEFQQGTNPTDSDSDNDGLVDSQEVTLGTQPLNPDTDGDGLWDGHETTTSPLLADTDGDTFPDNIELEQGSNPILTSSVPFNFPGVISLQFISERMGAAALGAGEPAGVFRFPRWNASDLLPQWMPNGGVLSGSKSALKNHRGQATTAAATWSYHFAGEGLHKGPGDEKLLNGSILAQRLGGINTPASLDLTGIPYPTYDLLVYIGYTYPNARGFLELGANPATQRYFRSSTEPPFLGWKEITAASQATIQFGNFVRYQNLTGSTQSITLRSLLDGGVSIHGIQIVNSAEDTDGDGMSDATEVFHRFNPAVQDASADADSDGLENAAELTAGTDPRNRDTDRDGIADGAEAGFNTFPLNPDSDGDTLTDGEEINGRPFPSLPRVVDSDGDAFTDRDEINHSSDPMSAASTPPTAPVWNPGTRTWLWQVDHLQLLWNHPRSMLGALDGDEVMLFEAVTDINESGWMRQIGMGIRYVRGRLTYRFRGIEGAFHRQNQPGDGYWHSDWNTLPADLTRSLGLSGHGDADDTVPLRLRFSATQPDAGTNLWTLEFLIQDLSNTAAPVTLASWTQTSAVAADPSLLAGTTVWKNQGGLAGRCALWSEPGVRAFITATPIGTLDGDSDGMPNAWETTYLFNPALAADAALDADNDGLSNLQEYLTGTLPRHSDSDNDGVSDGVELTQGSNPLLASSRPAWFNFTGKIDDLNNDGLSDSWILWNGGKSRNAAADDDGDGMSNLAESIAGTNPDDAASLFNTQGWRSGNDWVLSWSNLPHKAMHLESSAGLAGWQAVTGLPPSSVVAGRRQVTVPGAFLGGTPAQFYRAAARPLDSDNDGVEDWVESNFVGSSLVTSNSLGQALVRANGQPLTGDAKALLDQLQGSAPSGGSPGTAAPAQPSAVNASRFLMQATFGPTIAAIQDVRDRGFSNWIDHQASLAPSLLQPYIREIKADAAGPRIDKSYNYNELDSFLFGNNVTTPFARNAIGAEDQLRQRVAFALSQILVVSRRDANLEEKSEAMANYYDTLIRHALGNYRDLLRALTFHPAMGWYLSHAGNQKADPSIPRYPDENYAREIMQLFTIGVWELNPDGSRKLDGAGEPIPTYDNDDVSELARTFTGLYFASPWGWGGGGWADEHFIQPMVMYPERHDFGVKYLPNNSVVPAREATEANGNQDIRDAVDALFEHPNTPPFVCRQLIQFLVTDNPSPGYIQRVQGVFVNDGGGVRGNLAAVVKAILLDPEARTPPRSATYGKVREPVIRTMHLGRILNLTRSQPKFVWWNWVENFYGSSIQEPMNSPSVFNFYTPVYQAPGVIRNAGLVSPGFQIMNTYSAVSFPNLLWDYLHDGFKAGYSLTYPLDFSEMLLLADHPPALVDHVNLLVCAGSLSARTRGAMLGVLSQPELSPKDRVALALWTAMTSPEGVIQR